MILTLGAGSVSQLGPMILGQTAGKRSGFTPAPDGSLGPLNFFSVRSQNIAGLITTFFLARLIGQREIAMESEKTMYWMTLGVLAMAAATGFVSEHRGWSDRLADRSIAVISQASEKATNYAEIAGVLWGSNDSDAVHPAQVEVAFHRVMVKDILLASRMR